jgi:hypothetical protein
MNSDAELSPKSNLHKWNVDVKLFSKSLRSILKGHSSRSFLSYFDKQLGGTVLVFEIIRVYCVIGALSQVERSS